MRFKIPCIFILIFSIQFIELSACTCIGNSTVPGAIEDADFVAVGRVTGNSFIGFPWYDSSETIIKSDSLEWARESVSFEYIFNRYEVVVEQTFKGTTDLDTVFIYTGFGNGDCGFPFGVGGRYIIYGSLKDFGVDFGRPGGNKYSTTICTRTTTFNESEYDELIKLTK